MANTIKGGASQNPDESWVDANGKPLSSRQVEEFLRLADEKADAIAEAEESRASEAVTVVTETPPKRPRRPSGRNTRKTKVSDTEGGA
jgi:hypothetical protein